MFVTRSFPAIAIAIIGIAAGCSTDTGPEARTAHKVYGPGQSLGQGTARLYATLNAEGKPVALGVALSETALNGLPQTPMPGTPAAATLMLALPEEARATGFDHVMLDWNPAGHEPHGVYTLPHFDFHFYTISETAQMAIAPSDPAYDVKMENLPAQAYRPEGTIKLPGGVPMMGAHWVDPTSGELQPPPNAQTFTRTFLYGSYDGHFIFYEPMITKAYIESVQSVAGYSVTAPVRVAQQVERPGFYPSAYTVSWDGSAREYRIALDSLVQRN